MFKGEVCACLYWLPWLTIVESGYGGTEENAVTPKLGGN